jgi:hypothetical protein
MEIPESLPSCSRCGADGRTTLVFRLHGEKGGPIVCRVCAEWIDALYGPAQRQMRQILGDFGVVVPGSVARSKPGELTRELLDDAVRLTHPDRHTPERLVLATRVTAALTALRPYVQPAPKVAAVTDRAEAPLQPTKEPLRSTFPCYDCIKLVPLYYCDEWSREWEARQRSEREIENAKRRKSRARKRAPRAPLVCAVCGNTFRGRSDAKCCSGRCRVCLHRKAGDIPN